MESHGAIILTGETRELGAKPLPVPLRPPHPTWTDLGTNPALLDERPAINRLSYDTAFRTLLMYEN
jgi:hypothetical protein